MRARFAALLGLSMFACGGRAADGGDLDAGGHDAIAFDTLSPPPGSSHPGSSPPCRSSADCAGGLGCAYAIGGGCGAAGTCQPLGEGCTDGMVCACDGTAVTSCGFLTPNVATKPTPSPVYDPPVPPGDISSDAWCANVIANPSPSGCGLGVTIYECPHGTYTAGCSEIVPGPGPFPQVGVDAGLPVYPPGCTAQLAGCTAGFTATPTPLACYCQRTPTADGGYGWVCPD
jgi:hypothetical protein